MHMERATGTLTIENGPDNCALYFLFGHLFHASGASGLGEDVVIDALGWQAGNFRFDPRAKLPAEETIKASPADLISEASKRGQAQPAGAGNGSAWASSGAEGGAADYGSYSHQTAYAPEAPAPESHAGSEASSAEAPQWDQAAAAQWDQGYGVPAEEPAHDPGYTSAWGTSAEPASTDAWTASTESAPVDASSEAPAAWTTPTWEPPAPPAEAETTEPAGTATWSPEEAPAAWAEAAAPEPVPTAVAEPEPADAAWSEPAVSESAVPLVAGAAFVAPLTTMYPLPAGRNVYEGLKSAFVDFPKLLRSLRADGHTGYIRLNGDEFSCVLLFNGGEVLDALANDAGLTSGEAAFQRFRHHMEASAGLLDVVELSSETVTAVAQLLAAHPMYTGLLGRFVNFGALLEHLEEEKVEGSVLVAGSEMGVILLATGTVIGAYTETERELATKADAVSTLAAEPAARIEVRSGGYSGGGLDVDAALSRPI